MPSSVVADSLQDLLFDVDAGSREMAGGAPQHQAGLIFDLIATASRVVFRILVTDIMLVGTNVSNIFLFVSLFQ